VLPALRLVSQAVKSDFHIIAKSVEPLNKYRIWEAVKSKKIGTEPAFLYLVDDLKRGD
jgi:hypothetical protein